MTITQLITYYHGWNVSFLLFLLVNQGKDDLVAVDNNEFDDEGDAARDSDSEEEQEKNKGDLSSDLDSEEERRRYVCFLILYELHIACASLAEQSIFASYDEQMEELLDEAYDRYLSRTEGSTRQKKRTKQAHSKDDQLAEVCHFLYPFRPGG